jgi:3-hydroxyacyl-CoA dehydrogenase
MINEGAKCVTEGIGIRPSDIDIVWQQKYGWPILRGGPMYYVDSVGLAASGKTFQQQNDW